MGNRLRSLALVVTATTLFTLAAYAGNTGSSPTPARTINRWTWVSGVDAVYPIGIYGVQGIAAPTNTPGARVSPVTWTDKAGNFWLFGGYGSDSVNEVGGDLNDLWEFTGGQWMWVSGSDVVEQPGNYGKRGVPAATNTPGARYEAVSWIDASGNLWLFGGLGLDSTGARGRLNDLWEYCSGQWIWRSGSKVAVFDSSQPGVYGRKGKSAPGNFPGARVDAASWTDASGNLWLFGGIGYDSTGFMGVLNDLWEYSSGQWNWMSGSKYANHLGRYGTMGTPASTNVPGGRTNPVTWTDASGNFWLFGGQGKDSTGVLCKKDAGALPCDLNDLWKYAPGPLNPGDGNQGTWTWMGGSDIIGATGVYGTKGTAAPENFPGARDSAIAWVDAKGNFWLYGGFGFDSHVGPPKVYGDLNDLWKYSNGQWTWVSGSNFGGQTGIYGTQGTTTSRNVPGARDSAVGWADPKGNLWLFGGTDRFSITNGGSFNDLWEYQP